MSKIVMSLDQGTSSSRTVLFNDRGEILASANQDFPSLYPQSGWVEQKPCTIWQTQKQTMDEALSKAGLKMADITAIGITNQRETVVAWDRESGESVGNAIVWQCRRTADFCEELKAEGFEEEIKRKTGLVADPYFSGTKIRWMLKHVPEVEALAKAGKLAFGTVDSWLIWKLTGGAVHATDATNASRTLVYNIFTGEWDDEILRRLEIPPESLPEVKGSSEVIGHTDSGQWGASVPIAGVAGDQQAALFGQACFEKGMAKNTYGTGCFLLVNAGQEAVLSQHGLLTTIAWKIGSEVTYALEGSAFVAGALVQWLRDGLELFGDAAETEAMAEAVPDTGGLYIVPAFVGLGAPHWDPYARGLMIGLTRDTGKNHIARAALEAIAYQSWDLLKAMEKDTGTSLKILRVDGGATANNFLCQFQADILNLQVSRPRLIETTAMGAAFLAGLAVGVWRDQSHIEQLWQEDRRFSPGLVDSEAEQLLRGWHKAVERSKSWAS
ncbi:MAG: glycerol kinase GlpK [Proteobacteria bacterium]|nr:glycerol kinase GlpK [Pseudomonadota bacterium]